MLCFVRSPWQISKQTDMMESLMLLFEQKTGLFDSVDQYARPVFIISALVDVKVYLNKTMLPFCGS